VIWTGDRDRHIRHSNNWYLAQVVKRLAAKGYQPRVITHDVDRHDLATFDVIILRSGWASGEQSNARKIATLLTRGDEFKAYVASGGGLLIVQPNPYLQPDKIIKPSLCPYPATFNNRRRGAMEPKILAPDSPLVQADDNEPLDSIVPEPADEVVEYDPRWQVVAQMGDDPALMSCEYERGRCVVVPAALSNVTDAALGRMMSWLAAGDRTATHALALAPTGPGAGPGPELTIGKAIADLEAESAPTRRLAEAALLHHGAAAVPSLEKRLRGGLAIDADVIAEHERLIRSLGDADFIARQEAYDQLKQLGEAARDQLTAHLNDPSLEISQRCRSLLATLDGKRKDALDADIANRVALRAERSVVRVLHQMNTPAARAALAPARNSSSPAVRALAAATEADTRD
jgi:hypothetical protein